VRERVNILGVGVSAINMGMALEAIERWIENRDPHYVCITGVHGVTESWRDPALREIHNRAGLVTPDGMPLVWLSRALGHRHVERVYGPDLMLALCESSQSRGYRHFMYGGAQGVAEKLAENLRAKFPAIRIAGTYCPPFRCLTPAEDERVTERINAANPDVVWVGLSTPKQERWMAEHVGRVRAPALIGVGAAFDFHAGVKRQAPRWLGRSGFEWTFRLATEPRRLWKRYLVNNSLFIGLMMLQLLGRKPEKI